MTEKMLKYFISKAMGKKAFRKPRISICVPSGVTEVEKKAVEEATYRQVPGKLISSRNRLRRPSGLGLISQDPLEI